MNQVTQVIKRYPQMTFWAIAWASSFVGHAMYVRSGSPVWQLAVLGVFLGGALVTGIADGRDGLREFFSRIVRWRVGLKWYAVALLLPLAARLVAFGLTLASGAALPKSMPAIAWGDLLFELLLVFFVVALGEEPGFRGFALPRLMVGRTALLASLILGVLHTVWHLPLLISGEDPPIVILVIMAGAVLNTWLFNNTRGSVLLPMLLHTSVNLWVGIFNPLFSGADLAQQTVWLALVYAVIAVLLVVLAGPELGRKRKAVLSPVAGEQPAAVQ
jgi:membrane protease YdiL (CAAX protease family)